MLLAAFALLATVFLPLRMVGQTRNDYAYTFTAKVFDANNQTKTLDNVDWTFAGTGGDYFGYDATKGQQFGSAGKPYSAFTLSTSGISGTITEIKVNTSGANGIAGTLNVTVGGNAFGDAYTLSKDATEVTFTGSASGAIVFNYAQTTSKAIYIKSISVTYNGGGTPPTPTVATPAFNPEEGTYTEAQTVSISCATEGATIRYTLDGTDPTENSAAYSIPLDINETTTVKAIALKSGYNNSEVASATYTIEIPTPGTEMTFTRVDNHAVTAGNTYLIVDVTSGRALTSANGSSSAPTAVEVTITNNEITTANEDLMWTFEAAENAFVIHPYSDNTKWLYCITNNNGARVGTGNDKVWTLNITDSNNPDYHGFKNNGQSRYLGVYNDQDWRTYTSIHNNIKNTQIELFEYVDPNAPAEPTLTVTPTELSFSTLEGIEADVQQVTVTGSNFDPSAISNTIVSVTEHFQVLNPYIYPESWEASVGMQVVSFDGNFSQNFSVRMTPGLPEGNYSGTFTVANGNLSATVTLTGTVLHNPNDGMHYRISGFQAANDSSYVVVDMSSYNLGYYVGGPYRYSLHSTTIETYSKNKGINLSAFMQQDSVLRTYETEYQWQFETTSQGTIIYPAADHSKWLYCDESDDKLHLGTGANKYWTIGVGGDNNYCGFRNNATQRYIVYGPFSGAGTGGYFDIVTATTFPSDEGQCPTYALYLKGKPLTASVEAITGLEYVAESGPSADGTFSVKQLDGNANTQYEIGDHFEFSLNGTDYYQGTQTLASVFGESTLHVRLRDGLAAGNYTDTLNITCGYGTVSIALGGSVSEAPLTATPTFSLAEGSYMLEQTVSISCTTENATIYYTLDGTDPTENSSVYSEPISIPATTTLKAAAIADGYAMSEIATATYTIYEVMPIADARALANNAYACVEGTVIFIDGRNVYVQNGAAGIDLFLNSNTVPANLAIGDNVRAYGKKTVYNGLVELTGIKGNNDNEFAILSNGNELPLDVQTVAALNADFAADNLLQSTRVKIENAIIGAINLNGNTPITQDGESINIYRIPDVPGLLEGDRVTFTAIVSCYNAIQLRVVSIDDIEFSHNPKLTATPTALSGLTYEYEDGGPSELAQFLLSGDFLTDAAYIVPSESFEVSTFGGELFTPENPTMVSASAGHFNSLPIFVRLKAGLEVGEYNERLALATEGSDTTYVNVSGTVTGDAPTPPTPPTPPVVEGNYVRISDLSQLTDGSMVIIASRYNATANAYEAAANTLTSGKMTYTAFVSATDTNNNEILPAAIADAENDYYWTVGVNGTNYTFTNANGDVLSYNSGTNFNFTSDKTDWTIVAATSEESALVPNYGGFRITNVDSDTRGIALRYNSEQNFNVFGAYSTSNISNSYAGEYNFFLDLFVKTEGGDPPTPPTPVVATPTFSPEAGTYYESQTVTISCTTEGATIYYSTDSENGPWTAYTEAIAVEQSMTIWAYAEMDGYDNSTVAQAEYLIEDAPVPPTPTEGDYVRIFDLSELTDGSQVIIASRYNGTANAYEAAANTLTNNKLNVTAFVSTTNGDGVEILPASIADAENDYYWTVGVNGTNYTFTNANGDVIGYTSGTNFNMNGENTDWTIEYLTSEESALVPNYSGFVVTNVSTIGASTVRAFALQLNDNGDRIAPYSKSNMNSATYNFFLDFFVKGGEGGDAPTPTLAAPVFTPAGGTYYEAQEVTISCSTEGATIYYSTESENGPWAEYEDAISVTEDMTIWAYAETEGYNNSPVASATYVINTDQYIIFNQDWENDWHGWTQVSVEGDAEWIIGSYQGNHYGYMNGYSEGSAHQNEDWLISPAFDLDAYTDVVLTFRTAKNYNGDDIEVFFSNDYDGTNPNAATWQTINCPLSTGSWNWVESGAISMDGFSGNNCYIAFKYTSSDEQAAGWEVDDILLVSGSAGIPSITATPNTFDFEYLFGQGPSASRSYILTSENLEGQGNVSVTASEYFEVSLDNATFGSTITLEFANGIITNQPLTVYVRMAAGLEAGTYAGTITHTGGGASATVSLTGIVIGEGEPYIESIVPMYIQGNNGSNNNRVPVATQVFVYNLAPNATYRYTNQFVDGNDGSETAGAGNVIYANANGFYRSTSPSLATEGGYGEFTTNEEGNAMLWCVNEPTANARFTPGNQVYLRLRINDGNDGTSVAHVFTTTDAATVLNFGTDRDAYQGTAFYAKSHEDAMSFAALYATASDPRPLYSTSIETVGVDYGSINQYANFYKDLVAGNDGWFGGILPNDSEDGINHIAIIGMDGNILNEYNTSNGFWQPEGNTVNPNGGLDTPIFIDLTYTSVDEDEEANVTIWNTGNEFVIENGSDAHYTMTVYSLLGQSMMQRQINAGSTVRVSHSLAKGLYVIHLQNNRNTVSAKVIVR